MNTAFLRQGDADRFTTSKPADRKRILAEVLDLSYYDGLEQRAKDRVSELRAQTQRLEADIEVREREAAHKAEHEDALSEVSREIKTIEPRLAEARESLESATRLVAELQGKKNDLEGLTTRIPQVEAQARETSERAERYRQRVDESEEIIARKAEIESGHSELVSVQEEDEKLTGALNSRNRLELLLAEHRQAIAVEKQRLVTQRDELDKRMTALTAAAEVLPDLEGLLAQLLPKRQKIEEFQERVEGFSLREKKTRHQLEQMEGYRAEYEMVRDQMLEIETSIFVEKRRLESELERLTYSLENEIRPHAETLPGLLKERGSLDAEASELESLAARVEDGRSRARDIDERTVVLKGENERLRRTMSDTRQKFDLLKSGDLECPLCGQELDSDGREHLRAEYEDIGLRSKTEYQSNEDELASLAREREPLVRGLDQMESRHRVSQRRIQNSQGQLSARIDQAEASKLKTESLAAQISELRTTIEQETYMQEERKVTTEVKEFLDGANFDPSDLDELTKEHRSITNDIRESQEDLNELRAEVDSAEFEIRHRMDMAIQARDEIAPTQAKLDPIISALKSEDFAPDARLHATRLEAEVAEVGYDSGRHDKVRERIMDLIGFSKLRQQLESALGQVEWDRVQLMQAGSEVRKFDAELSEMREMRERLSNDVARLPEARVDESKSRLSFDDLGKRLTAVRVRLGIVREAIERCERMEREAAELGRKRDEQIRERGLYEELSIAFGRNGIQALIIEDALPQIENDANDLLARLTDNRMSLKLQLIEGRRIRGSDARSEEMSIDISDEMGTRAYETFSGGESFRINFALRIALSRLLARRSGAPLPILFIDEGFGSQDSAGQERLIEAIQSIRDDFDKIVVITHVEGIKEAFDTRIQVQKTEMGSTFEIVWA